MPLRERKRAGGSERERGERAPVVWCVQVRERGVGAHADEAQQRRKSGGAAEGSTLSAGQSGAMHSNSRRHRCSARARTSNAPRCHHVVAHAATHDERDIKRRAAREVVPAQKVLERSHTVRHTFLTCHRVVPSVPLSYHIVLLLHPLVLLDRVVIEQLGRGRRLQGEAKAKARAAAEAASRASQ